MLSSSTFNISSVIADAFSSSTEAMMGSKNSFKYSFFSSSSNPSRDSIATPPSESIYSHSNGLTVTTSWIF